MINSEVKKRTIALLLSSIILLAGLLVSCSQITTPFSTVSTATLVPIKKPQMTASPINTIVPTSTQDLVLAAQQAALLYSQDFESGQDDGLSNRGPLGLWSIVTEPNGNHIYCNAPSPDGDSVEIGTDLWSNYAVEMRVEYIKGQEDPYVSLDARLDRTNNVEYYGTLNFQTFGADLSLSDPYQSFGHVYYPTIANTWYTLRMEVAGSQLKFYIDNNLIGSASDHELSQGKAALSVVAGLQVCVDDIRVWALTPDGQIAKPQPPASNPPSVAKRLASHKFPKLFNQNQTNDPSAEVLSQDYFWDLLTFPMEVGKTESAYLGPNGWIRSQNPNSVILSTISVQEFYSDDNSVTGSKFVSEIKPEWIMYDINGKQFRSYYYGNNYWSIMPNLNTGISSFIPQYMYDTSIKNGLFDGVFYDGINEDWSKLTCTTCGRPNGPIDINNDGEPDTPAQVTSAIVAGTVNLLSETHKIFPADSLITGNSGDGYIAGGAYATQDTVYADLLNGRMIEGFLSGHETSSDWLAVMRNYYLMDKASLAPITPLVMAYCSGNDYAHSRYVLASALMFDGYFTCTHDQYLDNQPYTATWWYDEYSVDLGTGKAVKSMSAKGYLGMPVSDAHNTVQKDQLLGTLLTKNDPIVKQIAWRRDFQNGIVLINPSQMTKTVDLNGTFRKILGDQDPKFNDGSVVTQVSLAPQSGIILLNIP